MSDATVKAALAPFTKLVVDVSDRSDRKAGSILAELEVKSLPTLVFYDGQGNETGRLIGPQRAASVIAAAKAAQGGG